MDKEEYWDFLMEEAGVSEETLRVVTSINGYTVETLNDILYAVTGYDDVEIYKKEAGYGQRE